MKNLKIALIICFSLCFCGGCISFRSKVEWPMPQKPELQDVKFVPVENGYIITEEDGLKLANNVDEMKAYIEKLEFLIEKMKKYYK
jgi:hypothetical protein